MSTSKFLRLLEKRELWIIEDNPRKKPIIKLLKQFGYKSIAEFTSAKEALDTFSYVKEFNVDDIVINLDSADTDPFHFIRQLSIKHFKGVILIYSKDDKLLSLLDALAAAHGIHVITRLTNPMELKLLECVETFIDHVINCINEENGDDKSQLLTTKELKKLLDEDKLYVYYQPKVHLVTREVVGVEALARLDHPEQGPIPPDIFISIAESNIQLIDQLTYQMLKKTIRQRGEWLRQHLYFGLSINISVRNLANLKLPDIIVRIAQEESVPLDSMILEFQEDQLLKDIQKPFEALEKLNLTELELSLDDFGTVQYSASEIKKTACKEIKIDRQFVNLAQTNPLASSILDDSMKIAKALGLRVVAEGIETQEEWDLMKAKGCDIGQGYFIGKPMLPETLIKWYQKWSDDSRKMS